MRIAVIGAGISGMVCAYKLSAQYHDVTVYEKNSYAGGHTNTHLLKTGEDSLAVDSGFIVFNKKTYPNFVNLLHELDVSYQESHMSFSVRCESSGFEYNGTNLNKLFAQRKNIFNPNFYRFLLGILDFNKKAKAFISRDSDEMSLREFIKSSKVSSKVISHYLIPMASAVWSASPELMWDFPARFILKFWENHGFLEVDDRPMWYVVKGGSAQYVKKLTEPFKSQVRLDIPVTEVRRTPVGVRVCAGGEAAIFDQVILACHPDQSLSLLADASALERRALGAVPYQHNKAILHTDTTVLPVSERAHAAWNYFLPFRSTGLVTVHYHMNILQSLQSQETYIVSLNPAQAIDERKVLRSVDYEHPVFTPEGMKARDAIRELSGKDRVFFAGAWMRNGFHEDGVLSALHACKKIQNQEARYAS